MFSKFDKDKNKVLDYEEFEDLVKNRIEMECN